MATDDTDDDDEDVDHDGDEDDDDDDDNDDDDDDTPDDFTPDDFTPRAFLFSHVALKCLKSRVARDMRSGRRCFQDKRCDALPEQVPLRHRRTQTMGSPQT